MTLTKSTELGIIVNDEHRFVVWPTHRRLPPGWRFTGRTGTAAEMAVLFRQRFVQETTANHIAPDTPFNASQWADTESDIRLAS